MNNDRSNQNNNSKEKDRIKGQQFFQGGFPGQQGQFPGGFPGQQGQFPGGFPGQQGQFPGGFPGQPGAFPGQPQFPGAEEAPRSAPPNFIPEAPQMERRQMGVGEPFREEARMRPRDIRRCLNRFTFIWLFNGNSFWFYPTFVSREFVQGFRWRRNRWEFDRINLRRIFYFRCF